MQTKAQTAKQRTEDLCYIVHSNIEALTIDENFLFTAEADNLMDRFQQATDIKINRSDLYILNFKADQLKRADILQKTVNNLLTNLNN